MTQLERVLTQLEKQLQDAYSIDWREETKRSAAILRAEYLNSGAYRVLGAIAYDEMKEKRKLK